MQQWKFAQLPRIEELAFNKVLERFYDYGISGLIRENLQNSLDGKLSGSTQPVKVCIETGRIHTANIPAIHEVIERIKALKGKNEYTKETIAFMQSAISAQEVAYISFEDTNTKGLTGAEYGYSTDPKHTYSAYAYSKGIHHVEDDENFEKARGGSHGIGKIASNAASDLYVMFFANCDERGQQHLGGTVQLIEHELDDVCYRATGYFTDEREGNFYPYENAFDPVFRKDTRGLKIIIPYFREQFNDPNEIVKAVCDSFFVAILQGKLEVEYNGQVINSETVVTIIRDEQYYPQQLEEIKREFTSLYLDTYINGDKLELVVPDRKERYVFDLHFQYNTRIQKGRMAVIRTVGMKIEDKKITNCANKPFNAVLIPKTVREDSFLKSLENESHTELSWEHIKDQYTQRNAKTFINKLSDEVRKVLEDYIRKNNPTDGKMETEDVLYDVENKFKSELKQAASVVKIGEKKNERQLVKFKAGIEKKPSEPPGEKRPGVKKVKRKAQNEEMKEFVGIQPNLVRRAVLDGKERLRIDLTGENVMKSVTACHLYMKAVDGTGKECDHEFDLKSSYLKVQDISSGSLLSTDQEAIRDVPVRDQVILLDMDIASDYNKTLKFAYYLEV